MKNLNSGERKLLVEVFTLSLAKCSVLKTVVIQHPDLKLPPGLFKEEGLFSTITLDYGLNMPIPIPDLKVDESGISATLSFGREPFATFVPWEAVVGFASESSGNPPPTSTPPVKKAKLTLVP